MAVMEYTEEAILKLLRQAEDRAATEVQNWIPTEIGDNISGQIVEVGYFNTPYGEVLMTVIKVYQHATLEPGLWRVGWMGAVLSAKAKRYRPTVDDFIAINYQSNVTPKAKGLNDYKLLESVVISHVTGKAKLPVDHSVEEVTADQLRNIDPNTGEIPSALTAEQFAEKFHTAHKVTDGPLPGEEPL